MQQIRLDGFHFPDKTQINLVVVEPFFPGDEELAVLSGKADGLTTKLVNQGDQLFVDLARQHHIDISMVSASVIREP